MTEYQIRRKIAAVLCMAMISGCMPFGALAQGEATPGEAMEGSQSVETPVIIIEGVTQTTEQTGGTTETIVPENSDDGNDGDDGDTDSGASEYAEFTMTCSVNDGVITVHVSGASDGKMIGIKVRNADGSFVETNGILCTDGEGSGELGKLNEDTECFEALDAGTYTVSAYYESMESISRTATVTIEAQDADDEETTPPSAEETTPPPAAEETTPPPSAEETTPPPSAEETTPPPTETVTPVDIQVKVETGKDYIIVTVTDANDAQMYVALDDFDLKTVNKGESVRFDGLEAGKTYDLEVDYVDVIEGAALYRGTVTIPAPVVLGEIKITSVTPGTNLLTIAGTATAGQQIIITTTPAAAADVYALADESGAFSAQVGCAAGTYTAVTAKYVSDSSIAASATGSWTVAAPATKPTLTVDAVDATSTTVVAKTTAGIVVEIKTSDYTQKVTADENGIVRFSLPHTYGAGETMTLVVYYGDDQSFTQEITVSTASYLGLLKYGDTGSEVETLTARLSALGYPVSKTSRYGSTVREAVRLFQHANGLTVDGIAGKKTQQALFSVSAIAYGADKYPTLVRGDRDMDLIYTLQQRLKDLGYYTIKVDGIFGSGTQRAVRLFQQVNGLTVTGKADNATQTLLYSSAAKPASYGVTGDYQTLSRSSKYKSAVVPLQRRLKSLGYYAGNIDGYFGSQTYRAVRNFQSRNGLTVTGVADPYTQEVLYSSSARKASGSTSSSSTSTGYRLLYWGCRGDAVTRLQNALIDAGYKSIVRVADGIFGQWTYDAVRAYQKDHGLAVDGIAGKNTQNSLYGTSY